MKTTVKNSVITTSDPMENYTIAEEVLFETDSMLTLAEGREVDVEAATAWYEEHKKFIQSRVWSYRKSTGMDLDDLMQEAFALVLEVWNKYDPEMQNTFGSYYFVCLENRCKKFCREQKSQKRGGKVEKISLYDLQEEDHPVVTEEETFQQQRAQYVLDLIDRLPENEQGVLKMHIANVRQFDIAAHYHRSQPWVSQMLNQARKHLREMMAA